MVRSIVLDGLLCGVSGDGCGSRSINSEDCCEGQLHGDRNAEQVR